MTEKPVTEAAAEEIEASSTAEAAADVVEELSAANPSQAGMFVRLGRATLNYGIGQILPQVVGFLLIPVYTAYLSPEDYGILELATVLGTSVVLLMRFGVPGAVTRFYFDHKEGPELADYVTTIARFVNCSSLIVGLLLLVAAPWSIEPWMELKLFPYVLLVVIIQLLSSNSELQRRLIQAREQSGYSAALSLAFSLVNIALAVLFVAGFGWGAVGMLLAQTLCGAVFFLQAMHYLWPDICGRFRRDMLGSSLTYGLGILPSHLLANAAPLLTRTILAQVGSLSAVGLLSLATRMTSPLNVLVTAFNSAYLPTYFAIRKEATDEGLARLAATSRHVWVLALFCFLGVALLGPPAIVLMTPERYHESAPLVPVLAIGFLAQTLYTLLGPEIFYAKRTWLVPIVSGAGMITTLALAAILAPNYGPVGVAWSTTSGLIAAMLAAIYFSMQTVHVPHDWTCLARAGAAAAVIFVVASYCAGESIPQQICVGVGALSILPLVLASVGDPTVAEVARYFRTLAAR